MSVTLMAAVWPLDIPTTDKMVLLALADAANDSGVTWIAVRSKKRDEKLDILRKCSLSERAIQGAIKRLCATGHLDRAETPGKGVTYTVHPTQTPAADAPRTTCAPQQTTQTPAADAGKPSITTSEDKSSSKRAKPKLEIPDWVPLIPWNGWLEMRKANNWKLTDHAKHLAILELEKLAKDGQDPAAVLDQSTMKSWRGLFAITAPRGQPPPGDDRKALYAHANRYAA